MFKKLKKFYENNRIYSILMIISIICLLIIIFSVVFYFIHQTTTSQYGNRLDNILDYPVENEINNVTEFLKSSDGVSDVSVDLKGRIIYIIIKIDPAKSNEDIQNICTESLLKFSDNQKNYYDIQFIVEREGFSPYLGSKSASQTIITWGNYSYETTTTKAS